MVFLNFNSEIVKTIKLRSTKLVDYGKRKEISASAKQRIRLWLQPRRYQYITISMVTISWAPTVSHLLDGANMVVKMSDNRAPGLSRSKSDLMIISLPADKRFMVEVPMTISVPTAEVSKGLPIGLSVVLNSSRARSGVEIGTLKVSASLLGEKSSVQTTVQKPIVSYPNEQSGIDDNIYWLGMQPQTSHDGTISDLIEKYLNGSGTLESLASAMRTFMRG
ncbi:TPA_asm: P3 [Cuscuta gammacytorhabdovirus 1]|nr:TPA_asm: P3 [Cuscuta gammacytorhabdovirus 1]